MRWYLDTEFNEDDTSLIELISIALVSDDGQDYYAHVDTYSPSNCNDWVKKHVLPKVKDEPRKSSALVRNEIIALVGDGPEFWGYYCGYDWVLFCKLFGTMVKLPDHFPKFCMDVRQRMKDLGVTRSELPDQLGNAHHALEDARWIRDANLVLDGVRARWAPPLHLYIAGGHAGPAVVAFNFADAVDLLQKIGLEMPDVHPIADDWSIALSVQAHGFQQLAGLPVTCTAPAAEWIRRFGRAVLGEAKVVAE